jgi:hypothetical protein
MSNTSPEWEQPRFADPTVPAQPAQPLIPVQPTGPVVPYQAPSVPVTPQAAAQPVSVTDVPSTAEFWLRQGSWLAWIGYVAMGFIFHAWAWAWIVALVACVLCPVIAQDLKRRRKLAAIQARQAGQQPALPENPELR